MNTKEELIFQALGAASMCWTGSPSGVFDSTRCKQIGDELIAALDTAEALKPSHNTGMVGEAPQITIVTSPCRERWCKVFVPLLWRREWIYTKRLNASSGIL